MLVFHLVFYLQFYILLRDPQGRIRPYKLLNRTLSCELVGDLESWCWWVMGVSRVLHIWDDRELMTAEKGCCEQ